MSYFTRTHRPEWVLTERECERLAGRQLWKAFRRGEIDSPDPQFWLSKGDMQRATPPLAPRTRSRWAGEGA